MTLAPWPTTRKLPDGAAEHIRASYARKPDDMTLKEFAADWAALFGVSPQVIKQVIWRTTYRD